MLGPLAGVAPDPGASPHGAATPLPEASSPKRAGTMAEQAKDAPEIDSGASWRESSPVW